MMWLVDIRKNSPTFSSWVATRMSKSNFIQLWIPPGFAHGFLSINNTAEVLYKLTNFWQPVSERSIKWSDDSISIKWPDLNQNLIISEKDSMASSFVEWKEEDLFEYQEPDQQVSGYQDLQVGIGSDAESPGKVESAIDSITT